MQTITPFLCFKGHAEEAMNFYTSVFRNSRPGTILRYGDAGPGPKGAVMGVEFQLNGQDFMALNGGPEPGFTPAISFMIVCETQDEIDELWSKLSEGGTPNVCGWLTDRFGVTWQVTPRVLLEMMRDPDEAKSQRVMRAMMTMAKLDIAELRRAYEEGADA